MRPSYLVSALSSLSLAAAWTTYVVPYSSGGDDTPALTAAFASNTNLATDATILFRKGVTYNILTPITFPILNNVIVSIEGNITYGHDIATTQGIVQSSSYPGHWFHFSGGTNVTLQGCQDSNWGWVDANGQKWWDAMKAVSSRVNRPYGWGFEMITNGEIKYMKLWQPIAWSFSTFGSSNVHIHDNLVHAVSSSKASPWNTDAFDATGTDQLFENNVVYNADDCLAVNNPAKNIIFRNSYCYGSHGLSISPGQATNADIENILIENVIMENSVYAARYKSIPGTTGNVKNVTWKDITLKKVLLPIYVTQSYWDQDDGNESNTSQACINIDTLTFQNFQGTIDDSHGNGVKGSTGKEVIIFDFAGGTAQSLLAKNISATTLSGSKVRVMCNPYAISNDVGFECWDGLYQATAAGV